MCGSGKSLTIMLGGYPDTTTKTPNTRGSKEDETKIASMDDRNNRKAKELMLRPLPLYISVLYCAVLALKYPAER